MSAQFCEDGCFGGQVINRCCPQCEAALMENALGDIWCSCMACDYICFASDPKIEVERPV